jgi:hypothetical protein
MSFFLCVYVLNSTKYLQEEEKENVKYNNEREKEISVRVKNRFFYILLRVG